LTYKAKYAFGKLPKGRAVTSVTWWRLVKQGASRRLDSKRHYIEYHQISDHRR
jgi:hypothetical protein